MSRALLWVFITFVIPVLSTIYWLVVHWLQTDVFWNSFTLTCAAGVGLILCGMLLETLKQLMPG
jgi:ABC-type Fe3+ transport system permease subunit